MNRDNIIESFIKHGINFFPLKPRSKIPMFPWKDLQQEHFKGDIPAECNFAVVCGAISDNTVVFDFDDCNDINQINDVVGDALHRTLVVKTRRGYHVYVRSNHLPKNMKLKRDHTLIDVQSEGKYVVAPTSIHPEGMEYEVVSDTVDICLVDVRKEIERMLENGYTPALVTEDNQVLSGRSIAKGGIKNGMLHNSFRTYCNFLVMDIGVKDKHTYETLTDVWNRKGNNEFMINTADFQRTREDCWKFANKKLGNDPTNEDGEPDHDDWALEIRNQFTFKTMRDTEEVFYYENGIYKPNGESVIKEQCQRIIQKCRNYDVTEVMGIIKRSTPCDRSLFDKDPDLVNCKNCILNVKTGEIIDHTPDLLFRTQIPVTYDPGVLPIEVPRFLRECHLDNKTYYKVLEEAAYILLKDPVFQVAFMHTGEGSNGKSVWLKWLERFFGEENCTNISIHELARNRFKIAELDSKLLNIYADIRNDALEDNDLIKTIIAGDTLTVERKNKHPFKINPYAKLFFSANKIPEISDDSIAMYRRFSITPWDVVFDETKRDVKKLDKMSTEQEMSGMLNLFMKVLKRLQNRGRFAYDESIANRKKAWVHRADQVTVFINEFVVKQDGFEIFADELYAKYMDYTNESGKVTEKQFSDKIIRSMGVTKRKTRRDGEPVYKWINLTLRENLKAKEQTTL